MIQENLGLIISGLIWGSFGFFLPSKYEMNQSQFFVRLNEPNSVQGGNQIIRQLINYIVWISFVVFLDINVLNFFDLYPLSQNNLRFIVFIMFAFAFIAKFMRYLIFKWRLTQ